MQNPAIFVGSLQQGQEGLNIARSAMGLRNHMSLTDGILKVEEQKS
jgi:hypothetical protein